MSGPRRKMTLASLSDQLTARVVREIVQDTADAVTLRFVDGAELVIRQHGERLQVTLHAAEPLAEPRRRGSDPSPRQREYLEFIKRYMSRYGVSPAETDIQVHFMVSAPSVNNMVRTLERRGFVARGRDWSGQTVPRSIRVLWDG